MIEETEYKKRLRESGLGLSESEIDKQWEMRLARDYDHEWHVAINKHGESTDFAKMQFMYEAKTASLEVERLAHLFKREREGKLDKIFRPCTRHPEGKHIEDNHTFCCLGSECRKCPHLLALDAAKMPIEQIDRAKAWTCVSHILANGGDPSREGFVLTVDDRMFWDNVYRNLSSPPPEAEEPLP